jgi:Ca2+-binding EF-hand superfamily protein
MWSFAVSLFLDKEEEEATKKTPRLEDDELDEAMEKAQSVELQRMDELFSKLDKDGSGQLNETEFADLFNQYGLKLDPQRVEAIWDEMTDFQTIEDGSDKKPRQEHLSRGEFLAWILSKEKQASMLDPETFAEKCFKLLDQMGDTSDDLHASMAASSESVASIRDLSDGQISVSEFENGLARLGEKFSSDEVQALILELDVNDDNEFNEEEFMMWVTNHQDQA